VDIRLAGSRPGLVRVQGFIPRSRLFRDWGLKFVPVRRRGGKPGDEKAGPESDRRRRFMTRSRVPRDDRGKAGKESHFFRGVPKGKRAFWEPPGTPSFEISFQRKVAFLLSNGRAMMVVSEDISIKLLYYSMLHVNSFTG